MKLGVPTAPSAEAGEGVEEGVVARRPRPLRRAPRLEAGPLPQGPPAPHLPRLLPGLPPADLPIAPLGPAAARFPFLFQGPRGGCRLAATGPGTADGSPRPGASAPRVAPAPRPPPPDPASAAVGWMRGGCSVRSQAGAAAEAGRAPPSQRRGLG